MLTLTFKHNFIFVELAKNRFSVSKSQGSTTRICYKLVLLDNTSYNKLYITLTRDNRRFLIMNIYIFLPGLGEAYSYLRTTTMCMQ